MQSIKIIILLTFILFSSILAKATHIVGGEMMYDCLGNDRYRITLKIYFDCQNGVQSAIQSDATGIISIFTGNGVRVSDINITRQPMTRLPVVSPNPCLQIPPNICTQEGVYSTIVSLPPSVSGYHLVYQRCCRNAGVNNVRNPDTFGATFTVNIPPSSQSPCNSSPRFKNTPPLVLCTNDLFVYDHSANDPDNNADSLVYELKTPYAGASQANPKPLQASSPPFSTIPWQTGFGVNAQILGNPSLSINRTTGSLTVNPSATGLFVVGVVVKEYKNGQIISENLRDFQFTVVNCTPNVVAEYTLPVNPCGGLTKTFTDNSINAQSHYWDFGVAGVTSDTSILASPTFTFPAPGKYNVMLVVNRGLSCSDTIIKEIDVFFPIQTNPIIPPVQCLSGNLFNFDLQAGNLSSAATFTWTFPGANITSSNIKNPTGISYTTPGTKSVRVVVGDNGCFRTFNITIQVLAEPQAILIPDTICDGPTVTFTDNSVNAFSYFWDFGVTGTNADTAIGANPTFTYPSEGIYEVTLIVNYNTPCPDTTRTFFKVRTPINPTFTVNEKNQCIIDNNFSFMSQGNFGAGATFLWDFGSQANITSSTLRNPSGIIYSDTGHYVVSLQVEEEGCVEIYTDTVIVHPIPIPLFNISDSNGCTPFTVEFRDSSISFDSLDYFWDFGDGNTSNLKNPIHTYVDAGVYTVSLRIVSDLGCIYDTTITKKGLITARPTPNASFTVNPDVVNVFNPTTQITNFTTDGSVLYYIVDQRDTLFDENPALSFIESGNHMIVQYTANEANCFDTDTQYVYVEPHTTVYVPNSFTPNNDGTNDIFIPIVYDATEYIFRIYDRWGKVVFESSRLKEGWNGRYNGRNAPVDVYVWQLIFENHLGQRDTKFGHVSLVR